MSKIRYYAKAFRWLYEHRMERNCRQKWRRMMRELGEQE